MQGEQEMQDPATEVRKNSEYVCPSQVFLMLTKRSAEIIVFYTSTYYF